jgi:hypothetical protein
MIPREIKSIKETIKQIACGNNHSVFLTCIYPTKIFRIVTIFQQVEIFTPLELVQMEGKKHFDGGFNNE